MPRYNSQEQGMPFNAGTAPMRDAMKGNTIRSQATWASLGNGRVPMLSGGRRKTVARQG